MSTRNITGSTKYEKRIDELDELMAEWNTERDTSERLESLKGFIDSSNLKDHDGKVDEIFNNRDELDLFVYDHHDEFIDV